MGEDGEEPEHEPARALSVVEGFARFEAVPEVDGSDGDGGEDGRGDEGVRDAAMMQEGGDRAAESPEDVDVGRFCSERHGERGVRSFTVEACTG